MNVLHLDKSTRQSIAPLLCFVIRHIIRNEKGEADANNTTFTFIKCGLAWDIAYYYILIQLRFDHFTPTANLPQDSASAPCFRMDAPQKKCHLDQGVSRIFFRYLRLVTRRQSQSWSFEILLSRQRACAYDDNVMN